MEYKTRHVSDNKNTVLIKDLLWYCFTVTEVDPIPEPVPVVTKTVRSRGKTPVTTRTSSRQRTKVKNKVKIEKSHNRVFVYGAESLLYFVIVKFSSVQQQVEETATVTGKTSVDGGDILKEIFPNEPATPTGIM